MTRVALAVVTCLVAACGTDEDAGEPSPLEVTPAPFGAPYKTLAAWGLFADTQAQVPNDGLHAFDVTSPLYADYTNKHRFFWLPDGTTIDYRDDGVWQLPVGAIVVKTFAYPIDARDPSKGERLLETRLMVREPDGWVPHTYVYSEDQQRAELKIAGTFIPVSWIDETGATRENQYVVPNTNECQECHAKAPDTELLGLKTAQLEGVAKVDGKSQVDRFAELGLFTEPPASGARFAFAAPDDDSVSIRDRARAYLDANCAHCHNPDGDADSKGLYLDWAHTDPVDDAATNWGACKVPTSAGGATCGHIYDVVPGDPDHSIMICRMTSTQGSDQMPPIGRRLVHAEGLTLIRAWIAGMEPDDCK